MPEARAELSATADDPMPAEELRRLIAEAHQASVSGRLTAEQGKRLATEAVRAFWARFRADGGYEPDAIQLLCEVIVQADPAVARPAQDVLFATLIEPLGDAFDAALCGLYDRTFAQIIDCCRRDPAGKGLDDALLQFGLAGTEDVLRRRRAIGATTSVRIDPKRLKKVFFPSRVTLGAEIAITATLVARVRSVCPDAQCILLAAPAIRQIFADDERVAVREVRYSRGQGLIEQLGSWIELLRIIRAETSDLAPDEFLIVDPDSRLTQLGLLPMVEDDSRYLFFPSRSFGESEAEPIGGLVDRWAWQVFGGPARLYPAISLPRADRDFADSLCERLRDAGNSCLITMNFGVGGNPEKRLPEEFEYRLTQALIDSGGAILMAKGIGDEELARSQRLMERLARTGRTVRELDSSRELIVPQGDALRCDVLAWRGRVGTYCALIGGGDEYVGYDSGGQHIAAALGTPTIDVFAHSPSPRFMQRWRPYGAGRVSVVDATQVERTRTDDLDAIVVEVMACHKAHVRAESR